MPNKQKTATKPPCDPNLKKITLSIPTDLVAKVDAIAKETGVSRATLINKILLKCTFPDHAPKAPRP
jgi:excinuclease UvrABC ATPase subunit